MRTSIQTMKGEHHDRSTAIPCPGRQRRGVRVSGPCGGPVRERRNRLAPWPLEDGAAFTLLDAVNEFAADVEPAPQLLPPRWVWAIRFRRSERVWAATGDMDAAWWNAMSGRTVEDVVEALRTAASMEPPLHLCPDCKIEYVCADLACVGHPARPDDELAREILCRRCWPDRPW